MDQPCGGLSLAAELFEQAFIVIELSAQYFYGDFPVQQHILRQVNLRHTTDADRTQDLITVM